MYTAMLGLLCGLCKPKLRCSCLCDKHFTQLPGLFCSAVVVMLLWTYLPSLWADWVESLDFTSWSHSGAQASLCMLALKHSSRELFKMISCTDFLCFGTGKTQSTHLVYAPGQALPTHGYSMKASNPCSSSTYMNLLNLPTVAVTQKEKICLAALGAYAYNCLMVGSNT